MYDGTGKAHRAAYRCGTGGRCRTGGYLV